MNPTQKKTSAQVYIIIFGDKNNSGKVVLENSPTNFSRAAVDKFQVDTVDLGELKKIIIGHNNAGLGADWFLQNVSVRNEINGKDYHFPCGRWFSKNVDDKLIEREITLSAKPCRATTYEVVVKTGNLRGSGTDANVFNIQGKTLSSGKRKLDNMWNNFEAVLPLLVYKIDVLTGDRRGAGTDANVFIEIYGENGKSGRKTLDGPGNDFERNQTDTFGIETVDLGKLLKIRILIAISMVFGESYYNQ